MSKRRREFYNQASVRYLRDDGKPAGSHTNLLVLWDFSPGFGIASVWLACPQVAAARSQNVVLAWQEVIPNAVIQEAVTNEAPAEAAQVEERADQEIEALLLGIPPGPALRETTGSSHEEAPTQASTPTTSATDLEEEANDRQSHKAGA